MCHCPLDSALRRRKSSRGHRRGLLPRTPTKGCSAASTPWNPAPRLQWRGSPRTPVGCGTMERYRKVFPSGKGRTRPRPLKPPCAAAPLMAEEKHKNSVCQLYSDISWVPHNGGLDSRPNSHFGVTRHSKPEALRLDFPGRSCATGGESQNKFWMLAFCVRQDRRARESALPGDPAEGIGRSGTEAIRPTTLVTLGNP